MTIFPTNIKLVKSKLLGSLIVLLSTLNALGQIDSVALDSLKNLSKSSDEGVKVNALIELSRIYWGVKHDSSFVYANQAVKIASKTDNHNILGDAYNNLGNTYLTNGQFKESLSYYEIALTHRTAFNDKQKIAHTYNNKAFAYRNLDMFSDALTAFKDAAEMYKQIEDLQFQAQSLMNVAGTYSRINDNNQALDFAIQSANIFIQKNDSAGIAYTYTFIGDIHSNMNNPNLALEYLTKANEIYLKINDIDGITQTTNNLGNIYGQLNESDKALLYYQKSLDLAIDNTSLISQDIASNNIGFQYSKIKDYPKALEAYKKSIELSEEIEDFESLMNTYNNIAQVYYKQGKIDLALKTVNKALEYEEHNNSQLFLAESHEILSNIYYQKGKYKKGFEHLKQLNTINDSLFKATSTREYMEMQVRFETERKEQEIELLKKNDEIKDLQLQRQKNFNIFWLLLTILLITFGGLTIVNLRSKQKVNSLLSEKNLQLEEANKKLTESENHLKELNATKDRFFSIIAHDLKNPVNAVMGFSELLYNNHRQYTDEESHELIKIIYDSSQNLYKLLDNLLQWSRSQLGNVTVNPELFPLHSVVLEELDMLRPLADKKELNISSRIEEFMIVWADKNLVCVIIRNLISNAIKFSNTKGKILISAQEKDATVEVSVSDNGIGINADDKDKLFRLDTTFSSRGTADEKGTGLGLLLCKEFVEKNGGTIWVENNNQGGSTFTFSLPSIRSSHKA